MSDERDRFYTANRERVGNLKLILLMIGSSSPDNIGELIGYAYAHTTIHAYANQQLPICESIKWAAQVVVL